MKDNNKDSYFENSENSESIEDQSQTGNVLDNSFDKDIPTKEELLDTEDIESTNTVPFSSYTPAEDDFDTVKSLGAMYKHWFLDYASYVILERAIPHIEDGLKPVQRRVLYAMHLLENGHLHKVAKIVGQTMAFHPHGDASINDALVQLGQKKLLILTQGNWGNILTGDDAAAGRYIEAKLSSFALDVLFDDKITEFKKTYDGTANEPVSLPVRFPLLLAQGAEGIAVGLSSKIYPHNPNEILEACIKYLRGESFLLYPDFSTGGLLDVERYNDGMRGGSMKCRAKIEKTGERQISITELPFGKTTSTLIDSIIKASEKGHIKIKHIDDMTAADVNIRILLPAGVSTDKTIDGLYAFTDCEITLSPNACVIKDDKPIFLGVSDLLRHSVDHTRELFTSRLSYQLDELKSLHLLASLEKIFIEERIYKDKQFEDATNEKIVIAHILSRILSIEGITFIRAISEADIKHLLDLKMARILRYNREKHEKYIVKLEKEIRDIESNLKNITSYLIKYYQYLKDTFFSNYERKTQLMRFSNIEATKVAEATEKLYFDKDSNFAGTSLKSSTFIANCSSIDDMIVFFKDGRYFITKIDDKKFLGKGEIIYIDRYLRDNKRKIYNVVYRDGKTGPSYIKRFNVVSVTRDREYNVTLETPESEILYFSANPNGEAESIRVLLKPVLNKRKLSFEKRFSDLPVRGRSAKGNLLTKAPVQRIVLKEKGISTLGDRKVWFDRDVLRINFSNRGDYLGEFNSSDLLLVVLDDGTYYTTELSESVYFKPNILRLEKFNNEKVWTLAYRNKDNFLYVKRFTLDATEKPIVMQGEDAFLLCLSSRLHPLLEFSYQVKDKPLIKETLSADDFITVKSVYAKGKRVTKTPILSIQDISIEEEMEEEKITSTVSNLSESDDMQNGLFVVSQDE